MRGPPPSFPGPPKFKYKPPLRKSPRISKKFDGNYKSPEERAHSCLHPRMTKPDRKIVKKKGKISKPQLEYLKSSEPLFEYHTEMVLMAAGMSKIAI